MTRESIIEDYLHKRVKALGGEYRRLSWIGRNNANDDLVLLPGRHLLIECKKSKKTPTDAQLREHERLRDANFEVYWVNSTEQIDKILPLK